jgi:hypothetical protein
MLAMVLNSVGVPLEGIGIIMGVDRFLDMCRTAVNVTGDSVCMMVIAASEGQLDAALASSQSQQKLQTPPAEVGPCRRDMRTSMTSDFQSSMSIWWANAPPCIRRQNWVLNPLRQSGQNAWVRTHPTSAPFATCEACFSIVVGKKASTEGCVIVAHNEDDAGPQIVNHHQVPRRRYPAGAKVMLRNGGALEQVPQTWAYIWSQMPGLLFSDSYVTSGA